MSALIEARGLGRFYKDVVGLCDVDVEIPRGVVGLLGRNGAGKSTFLKLVVGELAPSRGTIRVLGRTPFADRVLYEKLGFAPQQDALWGELSAREHVALLLQLSGFSKSDARVRAEKALARVKLDDAMHRRVRGFSKGMRQRTKLAAAIAHEPELLVLDEPLTGLDPLARRDALELFAELAREGASILVSSHVLHEIEAITRDVLLLDRGRVVAQGDVEEIRALLSRHPRRVVIEAARPRELFAALAGLACVRGARLDHATQLTLETDDLPALRAALPSIASATRAGIRRFETTDAGLEAVFEYLVGGSA